jgi:dihydroxyacetone kinase-like predicted kinase
MTTLNTTIILQMLENGTKYIEYNYEHIDELNVFPVPDGDTGTNLKITTSGA